MHGQVDLAAALERCSGSLELLGQVVSETLNKAKTEQLPEIFESIKGGNHEKAHFHSHSIKGASATIGFEGLSACAKELDDLVRTGTVDGCMPLVRVGGGGERGEGGGVG
jgi:HPt (histidine-containing phosphotransfer) domain-containing protein